MLNKSGIQLHSRYNPQAEALRYIDSLKLNNEIKYFILIEPGLGYIIPVLREKFTESKIIVLHIDDFSMPEEAEANRFEEPDKKQIICRTFPPEANEAEIQIFLEEHIQETNTDFIRIIEWRPSLNYYKDAYIRLFSRTVEFLKRTDAGLRTASVFGRRWFRNFFRNLTYAGNTLLYRQSDLPVIVTGSGPSLEKAMPIIHKVQSRYLIIAASSSVQALLYNNITPDIITATDGSPWALWHLTYAVRRAYSASSGAIPVALNLCAALPSQCENSQKLIINDGSLWQSLILKELEIPSVIIPQRGTVSATAAELAMILSTGNIFLAGMDFSNNDIRTHARPYSFDSLFFGRANRLFPVYNELFTRSSLILSGGSMGIYAAWFKKQLYSWPKRIYAIAESNNIFEKADESVFSEGGRGQKKNIDLLFRASGYRGALKDGSRGRKVLLHVLKKPEYSQILAQELNSMLFPGKKAAVNELEEAINRMLND